MPMDPIPADDPVKFINDTRKSLDDQNRALKELQETVASAKGGELSPTDRAKVDRIHKFLDDEQDRATAHEAAMKAKDDRITALETRQAELEVALKSGGGADAPEQDSDEVIAHKAAFDQFLRKGEKGLSHENRAILQDRTEKALVTGTPASAGNLAPDGYHESIVERLSQVSPIRSVATVLSTSRGALEIPVETGHTTPVITAENTASPDHSGEITFALRKITPVALTSQVAVTDEMLGDSVFPLAEFIRGRWTKRFASIEGKNFIEGSGDAGAFNGLANAKTGTTITNAVTLTGGTGDAGRRARNITYANLLKLWGDLPSDYAVNGTWAFHRDTLRRIRELTDTSGGSAQGALIFQPGFSGTTGAPNTILGHPYIECPDIPTIGAADAGDKLVYFGDFAEGYWILDRTDLSVLEDPYTGAGQRRVRYVASKRVSGSVIQPDALRSLSAGN